MLPSTNICCSSSSMDLNSWWNSSAGTANFKQGQLKHEKNGYKRIVSLDVWVTRNKISRWRLLWKKLKKDKNKFFHCTSNLDHHVPSYNPHTYSQNFDQGSMWADPDNHSRSFSARFAVPSTIFQNTKLVASLEI